MNKKQKLAEDIKHFLATYNFPRVFLKSYYGEVHNGVDERIVESVEIINAEAIEEDGEWLLYGYEVNGYKHLIRENCTITAYCKLL
jgi:hypothetical protein